MSNKEIKQPNNTLAKKLTIKLALIIISVVLIVLISAYYVVVNIVIRELMDSANIVANTVTDLIATDSFVNNKKVDIDDREKISIYNRYICDFFRFDYVYTYVVKDNGTKILLLDFYQKEGNNFEGKFSEELVGEEVDYKPTEEDLKMWYEDLQNEEPYHIDYKESKEALALEKDISGAQIVTAVGISLKGIYDEAARNFNPLVMCLIVVFVIMSLIIYFIIYRSVYSPAKRISESMRTFINNDFKNTNKLDESGNDEFSMIASSFNKMTDEIDKYLNNISRLTSIQERSKAEIDIASKIQQGLLAPNSYHFEIGDIHAMMAPAKNIGGDLYDYMELDDGRIVLTIADVSGKGTAASLFMAITLALIRVLAKTGNSPAKILENTNNIISARNPSLLFVTTFIGIYDPKNSNLVYCNAGHNIPFVLRNKVEPLSGDRNVVVGLYGGEIYNEETITLNENDIIFMYTDGVTEAINVNKEFFGEKRLEDTLQTFQNSKKDNLVEYVYKKLQEFVGDAEQNDDITMLSFIVKGKEDIELSPKESEFNKIKQIIMNSDLPKETKLSLCVAAEEIFLNICSYAFEGKTDLSKCEIGFSFENSDKIIMRFTDNGIPYDPTKDVSYDIDYDVDNQIGGLGKLIAFTIADSVLYENIDGQNVLTITKYTKEKMHENN